MVVVDMATSAAPFGKIEIAARKGVGIPVGWAIGNDGRDTTAPAAMIDGGALLPLGSTRDMGGHKGQCLSSAVDLLCGVLGGANWGPFVPPFMLAQPDPPRWVGKGQGHFFGALDINAFTERHEFGKQVTDLRTPRVPLLPPLRCSSLLPLC
jgi:L-2-hydroxycarboxylate dehydrogenase (NAD+)